jgi:exodeoxyribonuclease-1
MTAIWAQVYERTGSPEPVDVDEDLYGGFIGNGDRRRLESLRSETPEALAKLNPSFDDERLFDLLFRYRARNFPHTLSDGEAFSWKQHRTARLLHGQGGARSIEQLQMEIDTLAEHADERDEAILAALYDYADQIAP